jgi:hypothetical protein
MMAKGELNEQYYEHAPFVQWFNANGGHNPTRRGEDKQAYTLELFPVDAETFFKLLSTRDSQERRAIIDSLTGERDPQPPTAKGDETATDKPIKSRPTWPPLLGRRGRRHWDDI